MYLIFEIMFIRNADPAGWRCSAVYIKRCSFNRKIYDLNYLFKQYNNDINTLSATDIKTEES